MKSWTRKLEIAANITIIVVVVTLVVVLVRSRYSKPNRLRPDSVAVGSQFLLDQFAWNKSEHTLLLALKPGCPYCADSAPNLSASIHRPCRTRLVALFPEETEKPSDYIKDLEITVDEIRQTSMSAVKITGTPTLILVNQAGTVEKVWIGKLSNSQENDVLENLRKSL